jgi:Bacterial regulatory protein, Fis family
MIDRNLILLGLTGLNIFFCILIFLAAKEVRTGSLKNSFLFFLITIATYTNLMLFFWSDICPLGIKPFLGQLIFCAGFLIFSSYTLVLIHISNALSNQVIRFVNLFLNLLTCLSIIMALVPGWLMDTVALQGEKQIVIYGKYYFTLGIVFFLHLTFAVVLLILAIRKSTDAFQKFQIKSLAYTNTLFLFCAIITNFLLPSFDLATRSSRLGIVWGIGILISMFHIIAHAKETFLKKEYSKILKTIKKTKNLNNNFSTLESYTIALRNVFEEAGTEEEPKTFNFTSQFGDKKIYLLSAEQMQKRKTPDQQSEFLTFQEQLLYKKDFLQITLQENFFLRKENFRLSLSAEFLQKKIAEAVTDPQSMEDLRNFSDGKSFFSLEEISNSMEIGKKELTPFSTSPSEDVSELMTIIHQAIYTYRDRISSRNFSLIAGTPSPANNLSPLELSEREVIALKLRENNFNKSRTAKSLHITINTLVAKMKKYGF